jgi:hypothetical protein
MALFPRHDLSSGLNPLSAGLFLGHILAVYALAWLGRSPPLGLGIITRRLALADTSSQPGPS